MNRPQSNFHGVRFNALFYTNVEKKQKPWFFQVIYKGTKYCGHFADEREAVIAYDKKVLELGLSKPLNILKPIHND